ncbi:MAG: hypothetical protein QOG59_1937 [Solirubrobacteraceae bacterium]|jgi:hypothetical protein|nr:hypothetical protein [Solirubrobacteraceae bacterium]
MDPSAYALVHGLRRTRGTLADWRSDPGPVLRRWVHQSLGVTGLLLAATWLVAVLWPGGTRGGVIVAPPLVAGNAGDVVHILGHNLLVLAFHALACTAGFIAGSSLPLQAAHKTGLSRWVHERGQPFALAFVIGATLFSLTMQAYTIGRGVASVAGGLAVSPTVLLVALLPHALPELVALFLPLAAWIVASRRGDWDQLLAATFVTSGLALPVLVLAAVWEVYGAPHVVGALIGHVG